MACAELPWSRPAELLDRATTDARIYLNQYDVPALAYGPRTRNIHATDEAGELDIIVAGARALARFLAGYYAAGGLAGGSTP